MVNSCCSLSMWQTVMDCAVSVWILHKTMIEKTEIVSVYQTEDLRAERICWSVGSLLSLSKGTGANPLTYTQSLGMCGYVWQRQS